MESRPTVQHLWNRFLAAVVFVLGTALSTAAVPESQETRVSRAERTQLEAAAEIGRQLSATVDARLQAASDNGSGDRHAAAVPSFFIHVAHAASGSAKATQPVRLAKWLARAGQSRAPPSI